MKKAVILARGLGTRMRKSDESAELTGEQQAVAASGVKALIPIDRPFLDYVLTALADAGYSQVCLVIGPEHDNVRSYYGSLDMKRLEIFFAVQEKPLGTADATAAAEQFAAGEAFVLINSDNYYPVEALRGLREIDECGLAVFEKEGMLRGNIAPQRLEKFAVVQVDETGHLSRIVEKPDAETLQSLSEPICVSMNCWRLGPSIFEACRNISPSPRGELELPDAVTYARDELGEAFGVLTFNAPVLDMSCRADVPSVTKALKGVEVNL